MPEEYQVGGDLSDSKYIREPGNYHLFINDYSEVPTLSNGQPNADAYLGVLVEVLAASVPGQKGKTANLTLYHHKPSDRDGGTFRRKIIDRFFRATGLISDADAGKKITIDKADLKKGRHFFAKIEVNEKGYPNFSGADIYHPDDAAVINWPHDDAAMKMPGPWRRAVSPSLPTSPATAATATNGAAATTPAASNLAASL